METGIGFFGNMELLKIKHEMRTSFQDIFDHLDDLIYETAELEQILLQVFRDPKEAPRQ